MSSKKRKSEALEPSKSNLKRIRKSPSGEDWEQHIQNSTDAILDGNQNYNKIIELLKLANKDETTRHLASSALCKVFSTLWLHGRMKRTSTQTTEAKQVAEWLLARYSAYKSLLLRQTNDLDPLVVRNSLRLWMRLVTAEVESNPDGMNMMSQRGTFYDLFSAVISNQDNSLAVDEFVDSFALKYTDVRAMMLRAITSILEQNKGSFGPEILDRCVTILTKLGDGKPDEIFESEEVPKKEGSTLLFGKTRGSKKDSCRKQTGDAWLMLLGQPLTRDQRRRLLNLMSTHIEPSVKSPELLLDFLTDCCNGGGTEAIVALNGLHRLITEHALDYPLLYHKLYALLDSQSLHKKLRSRFLRLVNTFLASTHLPAALVASFIKRLSRLALFSPPAAIVAIVPLIYNLMQEHPACTPMLHRKIPKTKNASNAAAYEDLFDASEMDPNFTGAIDSSVWELDSLRNHWHPNVATIAKILAEQFLKQSYNLEDFLDHSYGSLVDTEVTKLIKKPPALEFHIPKRIFIHDKGHQEGGTLLKLWDFA